MSILERVGAALLAGAVISAFASAQDAPYAWILVLPATLSLVFKLDRLSGALVSGARSLSWVLLGVTFGFRWLLMLFPILSGGTVQLLTLMLGYGLAAFACLFLLGRGLWPLYSTFYPAVVGLLVVASLKPGSSIHPYLVVVGIVVFFELVRGPAGSPQPNASGAALSPVATGVGPRRWREMGPRRNFLRPWVGRVVSAVLVLASASAIIYTLPIAQGEVEAVVVRVLVPQGEASVGLGPHARLGAFARLKLSKRVVMRVWTARSEKLRGRVFTGFDGQSWHEIRGKLAQADEAGSVSPSARGVMPGKDVGPHELIEVASAFEEIPGKTFVLGNVAAPVRTTRIVEATVLGDVLLAPSGTLVVRAPVSTLQVSVAQVLVSSSPRSPRVYGIAHGGLAQTELLDDGELQLPDPIDPRLAALADELGAGSSGPEERLHRTVSYLQSNYHYSLEVGRFRTRDPLAEFLFEKKKGYCEYFASAATVLLRLQGVPTRYVSGLNVLPSNRVGDHYVVRESDAHAWIEAYVPGRGWLEADPTPPAEYEALHADLQGGLLDEQLERVRAWLSAKWADLRNRRFREIVAREPLVWVAIAVVAFIVLRRRRWRFERAPKTTAALPGADGLSAEIAALVRALERTWERAGHPRPKSRGHLEHVASLPDDARGESAEVVRCYYRVRFRGDRVSAEEVAALRRSLQPERSRRAIAWRGNEDSESQSERGGQP